MAAPSQPLDLARQPRKVYPFSVIPGGAYSGEELALARRLDPVVNAHYSDFETGAARVQLLAQDMYLYVSYRKGNRVFWTANKRRIGKGESVLCDGFHMARTRCGNRLSAAPQFPVAAGPQPTETALNAPEFPGGIELPAAPLFAPAYDAPAMPLLNARDRMFAFPTGMTGASPLAEAFPPFGLHSPMMAVADLPFGAPGSPAAARPGGSTASGGSGSTGSGPTGTGPVSTGTGPGGGSSPSGGTSPSGGSSPGGPAGGGTIAGASVPEPGSAALLGLGLVLLLLGYHHTRRRRSNIR